MYDLCQQTVRVMSPQCWVAVWLFAIRNCSANNDCRVKRDIQIGTTGEKVVILLRMLGCSGERPGIIKRANHTLVDGELNNRREARTKNGYRVPECVAFVGQRVILVPPLYGSRSEGKRRTAPFACD